MNNQTQEEYIAQDMASIIANQAIKISYLMKKNADFEKRNAQLQESVDYLRKEVKKHESSDNNSTNEQIDKRGK